MMQNHGSVWGVLERYSAASLHLGFTLLVFAQPWLVLATIAKRSIARTELALLAVAVLVAGIVISS